MLYRFEQLHIDSSTVSLVGQKAKSLLELCGWNIAVPDGFCLTTRAFEHFLQENGLETYRSQLNDSIDARETFEPRADVLRTRILDSPLPEDLEKQIRLSLIALDAEAVAVRSSGTKEDLANASFAGQYESFLNIRNADEAAISIKRCWASLFSNRVITYCVNCGIEHRGMSIGVIIQRYIEAETSGVLFTVNPITGDDQQVVIEACTGTGESVVGGTVNPAEYVSSWYRDDAAITSVTNHEYSPQTQSSKVYHDPEDRHMERQEDSLLSEQDVKRLSEMALTVQVQAGYPVDIEWVKDAETFYFIQSRPITKIAFSSIEEEWTTADFKDGGVSSSVCSTLMWSLYDYVLETTMPAYLAEVKLLAAGQEDTCWGHMFFSRPYWNLSAVKKAVSRIPGFVERGFDEDLGIKAQYDGLGNVTTLSLASLWAGITVLAALKKSFKKRLALCPAFKQGQIKRLKQLDELTPDQLATSQLFSFYKSFITSDYFQSEAAYFSLIYDNANATSLFYKRLGKLHNKINILSLMSGLSEVSYMQPSFALWDISRSIREDSAAFAFWQTTDTADLIRVWATGQANHCFDQVNAHIHEYRHHSARELDITVPCYDEDPTLVFESLKHYVNLDNDKDPRKLNSKQRDQYRQETEILMTQVPFYRRKSLLNQLRQWREFLYWREELRDLSIRFYYHVRRFSLAVGQRLTVSKVLENCEDIFFLDKDDIFSLLDDYTLSSRMQRQIRRNRRYYKSFRNFTNPAELGSRHTVGQADGKVLPTNILLGVACSPGVYTGKVRVITDIYDSDRLETGDILITKFTDPGWTYKFGLIGGVATETGGLLSHAAVIAREYGIPAVLAIENLLWKVRDGQIVTIDGNAGKLYVN